MNTARWQFETALRREGKTVTDHSRAEHTVLFRRNADKNQTEDHVTIFHRADSGIAPGYTLELNNFRFLVLNAESPENTVYLRSDAVLCNGSADLCTVEEGMDENFNMVTVAKPYAQAVPVFILSGLDASFASLSADDFRLLIPARYGLTLKNFITFTTLKQSESTHAFSAETAYYKPTSIDYSNMKIDENGTISGVLSVLATITNTIE